MQDSVNQPGFLFHDYETFGTSPSLDRPAQVAAIRTDAELNVLGEPEVFYCKPSAAGCGSAGSRSQRSALR
ncbi:exonuclease domain-containing protein, partial [Klebsiella pneumoniae]|uniref:exonuclease domain-containing protein n=1 Tax=Klebsiella pneumoniae TaxID=573 RepID=UPI002731AE63